LDDERLRALYHYSLGDSAGDRRRDCPAVRELAELAYDRPPRGRRIALVRHIGRCLRCAGELRRMRAAEQAAQRACGRLLELVDDSPPLVNSIESSAT
jgi:hypothetical protein